MAELNDPVELEAVLSVPPTVVKVEVGYTRNLGNFENVKVNLGIEDHVRDGENANSAMDRVYAFVERKLIEKVQEIEKELK